MVAEMEDVLRSRDEEKLVPLDRESELNDAGEHIRLSNMKRS